MHNQTCLDVDSVLESLQSAALNVLHVIQLRELRLPIKGTVPQLYLTISEGRMADIEYPSSSPNQLTEM